MYPPSIGLPSLNSLAATDLPKLFEMFHSVHGHRSLQHGAKKIYLAMCTRYPGHGVPMRIIQDLVAECPLCLKDRIPHTTIPHPSSIQTLLHHTRSIGIDHVTITPHDENDYVGLLLVVEHDTTYPVAYPVRDYSATTVATVLFKHFSTFGSFHFIYSDPGSSPMSNVVSDLNTWLGIPHRVSLIGRHESNGTEHVNALLLGHLRRLVHDERLIHRWASDTILPLINHALSTAPNSELGGLSPAELKFGTTDYHCFSLPLPLVPGNNYCDLVQELDHNLATIRAITTAFQQSLRTRRLRNQIINLCQPGDLILWNPRKHVNSFRSSKLAPKLLGPYSVISQERNDIICTHCHLKTQHTFHYDRVSPFLGAPTDAAKLGLLDKEEYVISAVLQHRGN